MTPASTDPRAWIGPEAVLVPVKSFSQAKLRLAPALSSADRAALARDMATRVVDSAAGLPVAVVCDDRQVAAWARSLGALVIWEPGRGLNGAVEEGVARLAQAGAEVVIVAAGDLPLATNLRAVTGFDGVTIVPDRRNDGTNVIALPAGARFAFAYGPGSFARHVEETRRIGLALRVMRSRSLEWDIDVPDDITDLRLAVTTDAHR